MPFTSKKLNDNTWLIQGSGCSAYLAVGSDEGVMIDTGDSVEDIRTYAESICGKPVRTALNTHGHFDHTGGNGWFDRIIMGEKAAQIAKLPNGGQPIEKFNVDYEIETVGDGFEIDVGGRRFEAIRMDGHSPDCIAWLDRTERILFAGDNMGPFVPMLYKCPDPQPSMLLYMESVAKLLVRREEYDYVCVGHADRLIDADVVNHTMMAALRALDGETDAPPPMPGQKKKTEHDDNGPDFSAHKPGDNVFVTYKDATISFNKRYLKDATRYDTVIGT